MTCAICTSTTGPFAREPLGKDDAMVNVCADCSTGAPVRLGPERGYECRNGVSAKEMRRRFSTLERPLDRHVVSNRAVSVTLIQDKTPGFVVERIARRQDGKIRDRNAAARIAQGMPWGAHARYLGADGESFLFEHPPEVKLGGNADVAASLEQWRRKP